MNNPKTPTKYFLTDNFLGTEDIEISAWVYYAIVGSFLTMALAVLFVAVIVFVELV